MELDFAIHHAEEVAKRMSDSCDADTKTCGQAHQQLADWLKELKSLKNRISLVRMTHYDVSGKTPDQVRDIVLDDILGIVGKKGAK